MGGGRWLVLLGVTLLWRAAKWNEPRYCPHCGEGVSRDLAACPRCGFNFEAAKWAEIGKLKVS